MISDQHQITGRETQIHTAIVAHFYASLIKLELPYHTFIIHQKRFFSTKSKITLIIDEASELSNIGINRIDAMLRKPNCPFVLFVGKKKLVKRKEFEAFISKSLYI